MHYRTAYQIQAKALNKNTVLYESVLNKNVLNHWNIEHMWANIKRDRELLELRWWQTEIYSAWSWTLKRNDQWEFYISDCFANRFSVFINTETIDIPLTNRYQGTLETQILLAFEYWYELIFLRVDFLESALCRKGTFKCQSLPLKQIGNCRLAYCAKHLLRTYCDLESRRSCSFIVTADEKQLASIWILIWINIFHKSIR